MTIDAAVIEQFGPPPPGIDLSEVQMPGTDLGVIVLVAVATLSVLLRLGSRLVQEAGLRADDYLIIAALVFSIGTCVLTIEMGTKGAGRHIWALTVKDVVDTSVYLFAIGVVYTMAAMTIKLSIILLYIRVFSTAHTIFRHCIHGALLMTMALGATFTVVITSSCRPLQYFWTRYDGVSEGTCIDLGSFFAAFSVMNVSLDVFLLVLPIPMVLKLQMSARKKTIVCALMLLGIFACAAGMVRIYYVVLFAFAHDHTWAMGPVGLWLSVEPAIGVVSTCMANVMPLYYWLMEKASPGDRAGRTNRPRSSDYRGLERSRLHTMIEGKLVLRPREDDEIRLTTLATAGRHESEEGGCPNHERGIVVTSDVTVTVSEGPDKRSSP
ncbi:hypothetical protein KVR01_013559 [Diaporthe batatas]|uniref:uncharacterized protein n=1 Tax=Diaporthe batatas TaxID=748121 RepID=UPI001D04D6FC|nr:uncharacterized protein KVR01_013559 [Diaporthe batatas]KAG8156608.1 hypothetical protein KVR01_013559 [Diaporthe batatas]